MFSTLEEVRSTVRARAQEDLSYFVGAVLGHRGEVLQEHRDLWVCVVQGREVECSPSETFTWLFGELVQKRAA